MTPRVRIYTTKYCGFCFAAKRLLSKRGVAFEEIDVGDPAARREIVARTGHPTVPVILIDEELIGGSDELHALDRAGELAKRGLVGA